MVYFLFICRILLLGLSIAQVLSTLQVFTSNAEYYTLFSLFLLGAVLLFSCTYVPICFLSGLFLKSTPRSIKAGILWPVAFLLVFLAFSSSHAETLIDPQNLSKATTSDRLHSRITALKYVLRNKIDIAGFPAYPSMLDSRHIPERYWLAKALGVSRTPDTRNALYRLLDDPHFNVVCMAIDSLGRRGHRADVPRILAKMENSGNWYEQWYGYRAIRRLGWRQKQSSEKNETQRNGGKHMQREFREIELVDTENQARTLADYFKEKEYTLVLSYRGDW